MLSDMTYAAQFQLLRVWIDGLGEEDLLRSTVLPGWTVADVVGHLIGTADALSSLRPADGESEPVTLAAHVAKYASNARQISDAAVRIADAAGQELLARLDEANDAAEQNVARLGAFDRMVATASGPMLLSDVLDVSLVELVVHTGDLARSLPDHRGPTMLPTATRRVATVLRELLTEQAQQPVEALAAASGIPQSDFIALAAGRGLPATTASVPDLPAALTSVLPLF